MAMTRALIYSTVFDHNVLALKRNQIIVMSAEEKAKEIWYKQHLNISAVK